MADKVTVNTKFNGTFDIDIIHKISNGYEVISPIVEALSGKPADRVRRENSPSKFTLIKTRMRTSKKVTWLLSDTTIVTMDW